MAILGLSTIYGYLGRTPDFSTLTIPNGRLVHAINADGEVVTYETSATQLDGGEALDGGNFANPVQMQAGTTMFKTQSTHTEVIDNTTPFVITPPSGGRVSIQNMIAMGGTNNTFSIAVDGSDFIAAGDRTLLAGNSALNSDNDFKVGNSSGGGGVNYLNFGVDEAVTINKGASNNMAVAYNIEVPDA